MLRELKFADTQPSALLPQMHTHRRIKVSQSVLLFRLSPATLWKIQYLQMNRKQGNIHTELLKEDIIKRDKYISW